MSVTTTKPPNAVEQIRTQLVQMTPEFRNALPSHIKPEKFQRVVMTVVQQNPGLMNADRRSLFASCIKCAADGLIPDGREAALVMFGQQVQYMPMLAGIQKRARNSGEIASIQAHVIYEHDHFVIRRGLNETIEHTPLFPGERGKPIGAYAIAKFKDGSDPVFEVMDLAAIERVRAVSRSKNNGPWVTWWDEMARKTVFRRLSKWLPMDAEAEDLIRRDDEMGAPTEVSNVMSDMPVIEADAFETSSAGTQIEASAETDPISPLVDDIAGADDTDALSAIEKNAAFKSRLAKLSPADQSRVHAAVRDRYSMLSDAAA